MRLQFGREITHTLFIVLDATVSHCLRQHHWKSYLDCYLGHSYHYVGTQDPSAASTQGDTFDMNEHAQSERSGAKSQL